MQAFTVRLILCLDGEVPPTMDGMVGIELV